MFKSLLIVRWMVATVPKLLKSLKASCHRTEVNVDCSSINYKDALAITGRGPCVPAHFQWCKALILLHCPPANSIKNRG